MSIIEPGSAKPPNDERKRALRWIIPLLVIFPALQLWQQHKEQEEAKLALAQGGTDQDPIAFLSRPPEQLLCGGEAPALCDRLETWKNAKDCAAKRSAFAELKAAATEYAESPSFMKLAAGVVNVEMASKVCKDAPP